MLLPEVDEVSLQRAGDRTEVVQASHSAVNLERGDHEHLAEEHVVEGALVEGVLRLLLLHFNLELRLQLLENLDG